MRHIHRSPSFLLVVGVCAALLAGTSLNAAADSKPVVVRVLVSQTTAALPFLLMAQDASADVTLKVDFFANHAQALAMLLRGDTDLLLSGTSQGWENRLDGSPIQMIDTGVWGVSSLIGKDPAIKGFADLKGKRIAMPFPGSPLDFQSRALLSFEKIDPDKDVTISYGPFPQSVQRLLAGQLDAAALPEPLATTVVKKNGLLRLVDYSQAWARFTGGDRQSPQVSLFATEGWARNNGSVIASIVARWGAASLAVAADPVKAAAQFSTALATDPAILEEAIRNTLLAVPSPAENRTRVLAYYQAVSKYLPAGPRPLDERFFVVP
jgi:ABC-type nitrate/sulfonate/bicarbonate transport system substrate-binding protein